MSKLRGEFMNLNKSSTVFYVMRLYNNIMLLLADFVNSKFLSKSFDWLDDTVKWYVDI